MRESGRRTSQLCLVSDSFTSLFNSFKHAFRHDGNTAIVRTFTTMSLLYRVFAVSATRDSETARRGARLLSHIEMRGHETPTRNTYKKQIRVRMPHSTYADLYTISDSVRQRRNVSGRAGSARQQRPTGAAWRRPGTNSDSQVANKTGSLRASEPWLFLFISGRQGLLSSKDQPPP